MWGCEHCGFMINNSCFVIGINIKPENKKLYNGCTYFIKPIFEDGKSLEPERLLLLAENGIRKRK